MKKNYYTRRTCRLCASKNLLPVLWLTPSPLADSYVPPSHTSTVQQKYPLVLVLCKRCGQVQLQDIIRLEEIYIAYLYKTVSSHGLEKHFRRYATEVVEQIQPPAHSLIVDIGSNDGTLLKYFKKQGFRVLGVDPAKNIANIATRSGIETLPKFFNPTVAAQIKKTYGCAAIITANNLFANIDDLDEFTKSAKQLLSPHGVFIFESFYIADLIDHMVFDFIYHEHLSYFSVKPLRAFFQKHEMELVDITRVTTKGGSLRYTVQLAGGPRTVASSVTSFIARENRMGLHTKRIFTSFAKRIVTAKQKLKHLLTSLKKQRKTIAGFGASATTTTLLYHFNLTGAVDFLIDEYPLKQHTLSPGCHIPVVSPSAIYKKKPDFILIFAWRFVGPIVEKNKKFLHQGGHFIVPLPKLQLL